MKLKYLNRFISEINLRGATLDTDVDICSSMGYEEARARLSTELTIMVGQNPLKYKYDKKGNKIGLAEEPEAFLTITDEKRIKL